MGLIYYPLTTGTHSRARPIRRSPRRASGAHELRGVGPARPQLSQAEAWLRGPGDSWTKPRSWHRSELAARNSQPSTQGAPTLFFDDFLMFACLVQLGILECFDYCIVKKEYIDSLNALCILSYDSQISRCESVLAVFSKVPSTITNKHQFFFPKVVQSPIVFFFQNSRTISLPFLKNILPFIIH